MQDDKSGTHELTSVVYDVPVLKEQQNLQTISTQDNVAYSGTIPLQQNVAYEQVQIHSFKLWKNRNFKCTYVYRFIHCHPFCVH